MIISALLWLLWLAFIALAVYSGGSTIQAALFLIAASGVGVILMRRSNKDGEEDE